MNQKLIMLSTQIYETFERLKTRDLLKIVFWMGGYIIVAMAFFILLYRLTMGPIDFIERRLFAILSDRTHVHIEGDPKRFYQLSRVVSSFGETLIFLVFPGCMCFSSLRRRRDPIAISIVILLLVSLSILWFFRLRIHV
jgi:hypothetical protein